MPASGAGSSLIPDWRGLLRAFLLLSSGHHEPGVSGFLGRGAAFPTQFPTDLATFAALRLEIASNVCRQGFPFRHNRQQDTT